jgi:hypothetical protein
MSSNISYGKTFADGRVNFTSSLMHRQDLSTKQVYLGLPQFNLSVATFNPFDSKTRAGEQKWYQRIAVGYSLQGENSIDAQESELFSKRGFKKLRTGMQHSIPINLSLNVLKYLQFSTGMQYNERWYLQSIRKENLTFTDGIYRPNAPVVIDTVSGFNRVYDYSLNSGFSTKFYGLVNLKKGKISAVRHVVTPTVGFSYRPDFAAGKYGYYGTIEENNRTTRYSYYENSIYGSPGAGRSAGISFSVDNNIEAKRREKKTTSETDTTQNTNGAQADKIPIIQGLSFSGFYNFVADSFKLSPISISGRTAFFKQKLGLNFGGTFDPYQTDINGRRIDRYSLSTGRLARLTDFRLSTDFSLNSTALSERSRKLNGQQDNKNLTPQQQQEINMISRNPNAFVDFNVPWNISASYSLNFSKQFDTRMRRFRSVVTNTLNFNGDLSVTPKWKVQYSSGYDFQRNEISYTQFSIFRDLHCWDLNINWIPFGNFRSYSVDLKVKASILQDLKLSKRRTFMDNY